MAEMTRIEWADRTWSPWTGCTNLSPACDNCYAEAWAKRTGIVGWGAKEPRRRTSDAYWKKLDKWNAEGPSTIFPSLCDPFDNHKSIDITWRMDFWAAVERNKNLTFLLLTKRPQNIAKMLPHPWNGGWPNVWLGTTAENQDEADRRVPALLDVPAAGHFLSCEPLLGPVSILKWLHESTCWILDGGTECTCFPPTERTVDWVIVGGESGPGARPMDVVWADDIRVQCATSDASFFMKQMGGKRKPFPTIPAHLDIQEFPASLPRASA